jgi:hypothetical protein
MDTVVICMDSSSQGQRQHLDLLRSHVNESVNLLLYFCLSILDYSNAYILIIVACFTVQGPRSSSNCLLKFRQASPAFILPVLNIAFATCFPLLHSALNQSIVSLQRVFVELKCQVVNRPLCRDNVSF